MQALYMLRSTQRWRFICHRAVTLLPRSRAPLAVACRRPFNSPAEESKRRETFFEHVKSRDTASAWAAYIEATAADEVDKYMVSALVGLVGRSRRPRLLLQLWRAVCEMRHPGTGLDAHLCSNFILAFGNNGDLDRSREVVKLARSGGLLTTRVYNTFLATLLRTAGSSSASVVDEAGSMLAEMEASEDVELDAYTLALGTSLYGRARRLNDARALIQRHEDLVDTVVLNTFIDLCGRAGEGHTHACAHACMHAYAHGRIRACRRPLCICTYGGEVHLALGTLERMETVTYA